jgi:SAM-dependent methyltransferase
MNAADNWRDQLAAWDIPKEIIDQAEESPWIHPPAVFQIPEQIEVTISHQIALDVLNDGGSVLDIGCGGGIAAFALVPPATFVIGIDHQQEMLDMFTVNAEHRKVKSKTIFGFWPDVANQAPVADVVTAHHVLYNVPKVEEFLTQMNLHANKRVVIEIPTHHPLSNMSELWKHFWKLERPTGPSYLDLLEVIKEQGFDPKVETWQGELRSTIDADQAAEFMRIRLCLPKSRLPEVKDLLANPKSQYVREIATIWWDKK